MSERFGELVAEAERRRVQGLSKRELVTEAIEDLGSDCNELELEPFEMPWATVYPVISYASEGAYSPVRSMWFNSGEITVQYSYDRPIEARAVYVALGRLSNGGIKAYDIDAAIPPDAQIHRMAISGCATRILNQGAYGRKIGEGPLYARTRTAAEFRDRLAGSQLRVRFGEGTTLSHTLGPEKPRSYREATIEVAGDVEVRSLPNSHMRVRGNRIQQSRDPGVVKVTLPSPVTCVEDVDSGTQRIEVTGPQQIATICQHNVRYGHTLYPATDDDAVHEIVAAHLGWDDVTKGFINEHAATIAKLAPRFDAGQITAALVKAVEARRPRPKSPTTPAAIGPLKVMAFLATELGKYGERQTVLQ